MNHFTCLRQRVFGHLGVHAVLLAGLLALSTAAIGQQFVIGAYHLQQSTRISLTQYDYTYTVEVTNNAMNSQNIVGTVTSTASGTVVRKGTVMFGRVARGATVTSTDTFIIRQNRTVPFNPASLVWTFPTPAGPTAVNVTVPNIDTTNEPGGSSAYPFGQSSMRYQQVYAASQFATGGLISEISFRPTGALATGSGVPAPFLLTPLTIQVTLSTTGKAPGSLSTTFSQNYGPDHTVVYNGTWNFSTSFAGNASGPNAADARITLPIPFPYNPSEGNLLVDITVSAGATGLPALDTDESSNGLVSSIYAPSADADVASNSDAGGLVTQFTFGSFAVMTNCAATQNKLGWLIFTNNVSDIQNGGYTALAQQAFDNPCTLIGGSSTATTSPVPATWTSLAVASLDSFQSFRNNMVANMPPNTTSTPLVQNYKVVLYDNEYWGGGLQTPLQEKQDPRDYEALFARLAHANGFAFMSAPGTDLVTVVNKGSGPAYTRYLAYGFPEFSAASPADVYDVQAQGSQTGVPSGSVTTPSCETGNNYCDYVSKAVPLANIGLPASQGNPANPGNPATVVITGLSTCPNQTAATAAQLYNAVNETLPYVSVYWLNMPENTTSSPVPPACTGQFRVTTVSQFLVNLQSQGLLGNP